MGLDVYVMPLWRFKAGDFKSPIETALGIKPEIINLAEPPRWKPPWYLRFMHAIGLIEFAVRVEEPTEAELRTNALRDVTELKEEMLRLTGREVDWPDHGDIHYSQQFRGSALLRAFAAWHDHRDELPEFLEEGGADNHPVWKLSPPAVCRFPLLRTHSLYVGYFLPVAFDGCHKVEPYKMLGQWECFHDVASAPAVLREVTELLAVSAPDLAEPQTDRTGAVFVARSWAEELRKICALSVEHQLPVIFYG